LDYETFSTHETIIIQSCTGTGKTTAIAKHMRYLQPNFGKLLSIVTRTSLADQHCKSFKALGLKSYQDVKHGFCDEKALVICLNSLGKLEALDDEEIKEYTVFIDEVTSLLEFTGNDLLDSVMKKVVVT
jgi:superfamily II DNA or RNA helicase